MSAGDLGGIQQSSPSLLATQSAILLSYTYVYYRPLRAKRTGPNAIGVRAAAKASDPPRTTPVTAHGSEPTTDLNPVRRARRAVVVNSVLFANWRRPDPRDKIRCAKPAMNSPTKPKNRIRHPRKNLVRFEGVMTPSEV